MAQRTVGDAENRSFGLVGHRSSGKTSVAEMLLRAAGVVRACGRVEDGTALLDDDPAEQRRRQGCWPGFAWLPWGERTLHLVDTPGGAELAHARRLALTGADLRVLVVSASDGVELGAREVLAESLQDDHPLMVVLNKMDRPHPAVPDLLAELGGKTGRRVVELTLPFHDERGFAGVIDVLGGRVLRYDPDGSGAFSPEPVPVARQAQLATAREALFEAAALADDALLERYLELFALEPEDAWRGLARAVGRGMVLPVVHTDALRAMGAEPLLDAVSRLAPDPAEWTLPLGSGDPGFVAQWVATRLDEEGERVSVFRVWAGPVPEHAVWTNTRTGETVRVRKLYRIRGPRRALARGVTAGALVAAWDPVPGLPGDTFTDGPSVPLRGPAAPPQMAWRHVTPAREGDDAALRGALDAVRRFDPSLTWEDEAWGGGLLVAGTTQVQLAHWLGLLPARFGLKVQVGPRRVHYLERPAGEARDVHGLHCVRSGEDATEYGECWIDLRPAADDEPLRFVGDVDEDVLPRRFVPGIEQGVRQALRHGPLAGFPVVGAEVRCARGEYDALASEPEHFVIAGERAMTRALTEAGTAVLEPWSEVLLVVPSEDVGLFLADLAAHRGRVLGLEVDVRETSLQALVPDREVYAMGERLQRLSADAWFVARRRQYHRLPDGLVAEVVAASPWAPRRARGRTNGLASAAHVG